MLFLLRVSLYAIENLLPPLQGPRLTALFDEMYVGIFDAAKSQKVTKRQKPKKGGPDPKIIYQTISRLFWYAVPDIFHAATSFNANRQIFGDTKEESLEAQTGNNTINGKQKNIRKEDQNRG